MWAVNADPRWSVWITDGQYEYVWSIWVVTAALEGTASVDCGQSLWTKVDYGWPIWMVTVHYGLSI